MEDQASRREGCLPRPVPAPSRRDPVPWFAGAAVLLMVALITAREIGDLTGHPLPPRILALFGGAVWWIYWGSAVFFGLVVIRRWRSTYFRWRTLAAMTSQTIFGLLLGGPLKGALSIPPFWQRLHLTWPLHMSAITPYLQQHSHTGFVYGVIISLIAWPALTLIFGMRFCSWFCFCGNLAETAGDSFRTRGPKGPQRQSLDSIGYLTLGSAAIVTALLWLNITRPYAWYDAVVGFLLADFIGISLYPLLGSRVWCRFFCPLRAMLGWWSRRGRFAIYTDSHRCIECGTCNRYCEMGIDIRLRARQGIPMRDTECVACGACIAVCPRYALSFFQFPDAETAVAARPEPRFRRPYKRQLATPRGR
ncbi:MAG: 4Fe-4S binding protein [Armatimonadota bacterium]